MATNHFLKQARHNASALLPLVRGSEGSVALGIGLFPSPLAVLASGMLLVICCLGCWIKVSSLLFVHTRTCCATQSIQSG